MIIYYWNVQQCHSLGHLSLMQQDIIWQSAVQKSRGLLAERLKHHTAEMKAEQKNWEICHSIHIQREIGNKRCRLDRVPFQYQNGYWDLLF